MRLKTLALLLISSVDRERCIDATAVGGIALNSETKAGWSFPRLFVFVFAVVVCIEYSVNNLFL